MQEGRSACDATEVHDIRVGSTVKQKSNESALPGSKRCSLQFYGSNDTEYGSASCASLDLAIPTTELVGTATEQDDRKIVKLLQWNKIGLERVGKEFEEWSIVLWIDTKNLLSNSCKRKIFWSRWEKKKEGLHFRVLRSGRTWLRSWRGNLRCAQRKRARDFERERKEVCCI